jgi:predicted phage tail protein
MAAATNKAMTTILLSGSLAKEFGRKHTRMLESGTSQEAFSALKHTVEGFEDFVLAAARRGTRFAIFRNRENVGVDHLTLSGTTEIRIVPIIAGSKSGGVFQTIVGAVLIAAGAVLTYFGQGWIGIPMMQMGAAMVIGGVIQMLSPTPKTSSQQEQATTENKPSYLFNGAFNSTQQGLPVPIVYGQMLVGSSVVGVGTWVEAIPA